MGTWSTIEYPKQMSVLISFFLFYFCLVLCVKCSLGPSLFGIIDVNLCYLELQYANIELAWSILLFCNYNFESSFLIMDAS